MTNTVRKQVMFGNDYCGFTSCNICFKNVVVDEVEVDVEESTPFNAPRLTFDASYAREDVAIEYDDYEEPDYFEDEYDRYSYERDDDDDYEPLAVDEPADTNDYEYQQNIVDDFSSLMAGNARVSDETSTRYERDTDLIDNVILNANTGVRDLRKL